MVFEMKKALKNNIGWVIAIVSIIVVVGLVWNAILSLGPPDKDKIEKYFKRDKTDIILITEFLINSDYSEISINKKLQKDGFMFTGVNTRDRNIENEVVVKAVNRLLRRRGYKSILKNGNTISFEKWSFFEQCRGITYSINGKDEPILQFLIELEPLSENGWYYYEENYDEWRLR